ncbi:excisionase family DNA-binding protein [Streptomyces gobiensis]|uniref:excisionase family DNA-binding protein n=1 Tax=Streptomyces gobiensis TaxID=2875706 RepID=UPI001E46DBF0|nr:excisionase family DNA-binding protein [Streptomyces gobiensis]UGY92690.1 excisionase family DNA-binding protein [Streptomyces gobiensis]
MITHADRLLTVEETAERLGTGVRFVRRRVVERHIRYVKLGKHIRIADSVLDAYVVERTVEPVRRRCSRYGKAA